MKNAVMWHCISCEQSDVSVHIWELYVKHIAKKESAHSVLALGPVFKSFTVTTQVCVYAVCVCVGPEFMATWTTLAVLLGFVPGLGAVKLRL